MAGGGGHHRRRRHCAGHLSRPAPGRRSGSPAKDVSGVMTNAVQTAVVGVTGYAGAELARLLLHHPRLQGTPPVFAGRVEAKDEARGGTPLTEIHPQLGGSLAAGLKLEPFSWELLLSSDVE